MRRYIMDKKTIVIIGIILGIYIVSTSISYAIFSASSNKNKIATSSVPVSSKGTNEVNFASDLPKTEPCPINGVMYSKDQRDWWEKHRPLGIMIENHEESRPQSGISNADVVYEAVAEGGITRFLAVFYCQDALFVGPVRSARTYFLDYASEYGSYPLYAHVGGANTPGPADALSQIADYGWAGNNDLNQFSIGYPTFWRDYNRLGHDVATEHTMYSTTTKLWDFAAKKRELTNVDSEGNNWNEDFDAYTFKDESTSSSKSLSQSIHFEFWDGYKQYFVDWSYDSSKNLYKRNNGGVPHLDKNNNKQLTTKNIVVLFMRESNANDGYENNAHLLYKTKGTGKALIFMDGKKTEATWKKDSRTSRTLLFNEDDEAIKFNRGTIWFEILPLDGKVVEK